MFAATSRITRSALLARSSTAFSPAQRFRSTNLGAKDDDRQSKNFIPAYVHHVSKITLEHLQDNRSEWLIEKGLDRGLHINTNGTFALHFPARKGYDAGRIWTSYESSTKQHWLSVYRQKLANLWGFERINTGAEKGAYHHPCFVKDRLEMCQHMSRKKIKGGPLDPLENPSSKSSGDASSKPSSPAPVRRVSADTSSTPPLPLSNVASLLSAAALPGYGPLSAPGASSVSQLATSDMLALLQSAKGNSLISNPTLEDMHLTTLLDRIRMNAEARLYLRAQAEAAAMASFNQQGHLSDALALLAASGASSMMNHY